MKTQDKQPDVGEVLIRWYLRLHYGHPGRREAGELSARIRAACRALRPQDPDALLSDVALAAQVRSYAS